MFFFLLSSSVMVMAQSDIKAIPNGVEMERIEQMPSFPGGQTALFRWLSNNIKYPVVAEKNGDQGRVICTFVIERDGSITDIRVVSPVEPSLDKEAIRVIKSMPRWIPGMIDGEPARVKYTLPVTFRLNGGFSVKKTINHQMNTSEKQKNCPHGKIKIISKI